MLPEGGLLAIITAYVPSPAQWSGKSSLLDAFAFLADALRDGLEAACDRSHRGGFDRLRTQGSTEPIGFDLYYREHKQARPITYSFSVDVRKGVPVVVSEQLLQRRKGQKHGRPFAFVRLEAGVGEAWSGDSVEGEAQCQGQRRNAGAAYDALAMPRGRTEARRGVADHLLLGMNPGPSGLSKPY